MDRYFDDRLSAWVTVCPPGKALGADDIKNWGFRRQRGFSGSDGRKERRVEEKWHGRAPKRQSRHKAGLNGIGNISRGRRHRPGKRVRCDAR